MDKKKFWKNKCKSVQFYTIIVNYMEIIFGRKSNESFSTVSGSLRWFLEKKEWNILTDFYFFFFLSLCTAHEYKLSLLSFGRALKE